MIYLRLLDMGKPIYVETAYMGRACVIMGRLDLDIKDELEEKFRAKVYQRKGMKKGNLTESLEEAIILWMSTEPVTQGKKSK
jgi:hypothetical protein